MAFLFNQIENKLSMDVLEIYQFFLFSLLEPVMKTKEKI
jgi:hypothetical protein